MVWLGVGRRTADEYRAQVLAPELRMTRYVGSHVTTLLTDEPFKDWPVEKSVEDDLDERRVDYVFEGSGLAVVCDANDVIHTVFLFAAEYGGFDAALVEIPFSSSRKKVLAHLGAPSRSGERTSDPVLGDHGAWDLFSRPGLAIHVEYWPDFDAIRQITLMRSDVVP